MSGRRGGGRVAPGAAAWLAALLALAAGGPAAGAQEEPARVGAPTPLTSQPASQKSPLREFRDAEGHPCRVYVRDVVIDGRTQQAFAIVCREPSGRWVLSR